MISGHATVKVAVEAIRLGAYEFIEKPLQKKKLLIMLIEVSESARLKRKRYYRK